ncbi:uncharacterized protein LOC112455050 [Temnothorax curvispinosus]|uniref:Uncharacterized protein LOC112455050 n=1 Tax=Temnothorax curvispinosus TaxID=300111 RepID=A0A6J1PRX0_9HYME|nr:uncharacterized protein LOC112455050 [Temnothorax curvispinosus]
MLIPVAPERQANNEDTSMEDMKNTSANMETSIKILYERSPTPRPMQGRMKRRGGVQRSTRKRTSTQHRKTKKKATGVRKRWRISQCVKNQRRKRRQVIRDSGSEEDKSENNRDGVSDAIVKIERGRGDDECARVTGSCSAVDRETTRRSQLRAILAKMNPMSQSEGSQNGGCSGGSRADSERRQVSRIYEQLYGRPRVIGEEKTNETSTHNPGTKLTCAAGAELSCSRGRSRFREMERNPGASTKCDERRRRARIRREERRREWRKVKQADRRQSRLNSVLDASLGTELTGSMQPHASQSRPSYQGTTQMDRHEAKSTATTTRTDSVAIEGQIKAPTEALVGWDQSTASIQRSHNVRNPYATEGKQ